MWWWCTVNLLSASVNRAVILSLWQKDSISKAESFIWSSFLPTFERLYFIEMANLKSDVTTVWAQGSMKRELWILCSSARPFLLTVFWQIYVLDDFFWAPLLILIGWNSFSLFTLNSELEILHEFLTRVKRLFSEIVHFFHTYSGQLSRTKPLDTSPSLISFLLAPSRLGLAEFVMLMMPYIT